MRIFRAPRRRPFTAPRHHVGYGLGSLFSRIGQYVRPLLKSAITMAKPAVKQTLKDLGKQGIQAASSTALDVLSGESPKSAVKRNIRRATPQVKRTLKTGMKRGASQIRQAIKATKKSQTGSGAGRKRRRKTAKSKKSSRRKTRRRRLPYHGIFS